MRALLGLAGTLVAALVILGGPAVWWWDRREPHSPVIHILFLKWSPPDSLKAQLGTLTADNRTLKANQAGLLAALDRQNASVAALKVEGDRKTAATTKALQGAQITIAGLDRTIARLKSQPAPEICTVDAPWEGS